MDHEGNLAALWAKIKSKLDIKAVDQCWVWRGTLRACGGVQYGVIRVKFPWLAQSKPVGVHRATYMVKINSYHVPEGLDVSHLCGHSLCCNPNHLYLEPHHINNNRIHCHNISRCLGHGTYPDCIL